MPNKFSIYYQGEILQITGGQGQEFYEVFRNGTRWLLLDYNGSWWDVVKNDRNQQLSKDEFAQLQKIGTLIKMKEGELPKL